MIEADLGNVFFEVAPLTTINHLIISVDLDNYQVDEGNASDENDDGKINDDDDGNKNRNNSRLSLQLGIERVKATILTYLGGIPIPLTNLLPPPTDRQRLWSVNNGEHGERLQTSHRTWSAVPDALLGVIN